MRSDKHEMLGISWGKDSVYKSIFYQKSGVQGTGGDRIGRLYRHGGLLPLHPL